MSTGISPSVLLGQVENTAPWALDASITPAAPWQAVLLAGRSLDANSQDPQQRRAYLSLLLAAHFATVGTFVPTDVDARIRHHAWQELHGLDALREAVDTVDQVDDWDPRAVSARVVQLADGTCVSGHDGEWLAVRAGALGRALAMNASATIDAIIARIDAELTREAQAFAVARDRRGGELDALRLATVLAHNVGDLSRVVEIWLAKSNAAKDLQTRLARLGHDDATRFDGLFALAGHVNKAVMAHENHRFLTLRKARGLRRSPDLLLPIGPFFDRWGETVGSHRALDATERGAALAALLEGHDSDTSQHGYLRAIAGMHRTHPGGIDSLAREVPARLRKLVTGGVVREALRVDASRFEARMANRCRSVLNGGA